MGLTNGGEKARSPPGQGRITANAWSPRCLSPAASPISLAARWAKMDSITAAFQRRGLCLLIFKILKVPMFFIFILGIGNTRVRSSR